MCNCACTWTMTWMCAHRDPCTHVHVPGYAVFLQGNACFRLWARHFPALSVLALRVLVSCMYLDAERGCANPESSCTHLYIFRIGSWLQENGTFRDVAALAACKLDIAIFHVLCSIMHDARQRQISQTFISQALCRDMRTALFSPNHSQRGCWWPVSIFQGLCSIMHPAGDVHNDLLSDYCKRMMICWHDGGVHKGNMHAASSA